MPDPYSVVEYRIENLRWILGNSPAVDASVLEDKLHLVYFEEYFAALKAKTIVIETEYVDRDFLEDYAGYYVRCFTKYRRKCRRVHFFKLAFSGDDFKAVLSGCPTQITPDTLNDAYLGFVVVKPLPQTIIGRTCLKTYADDGGRRHYSSTQVSTANLFGIPLKIQTLPFQEQDSVVAACATSALWSVFHASGSLMQHNIPSPVEITRKATSLLPLETRSLPNRGLTPAQMAYAIRGVGLEPFLVDAANLSALKRTAYAYLRGGLPLLLGIHLVDISSATGCPVLGRHMGRHAVALTGFSLGGHESSSSSNPSISLPDSDYFLRASRIDKIYVHDDQVGPFARMVFDGLEVEFQYQGEISAFKSLSTSWRGEDGNIGSVRAIPDILLIPLYHKIRIPFGIIHDHVLCLDGFIETLRQSEMVKLAFRLEWDIYLTTVNQYKSSVLQSDTCTEHKYRILIENLPRFIWRATAFAGDTPLMDLLFDATDIEQSSLLTTVVAYDNVLVETLIHSFNDMSEDVRKHPSLTVMAWLAKKHLLS